MSHRTYRATYAPASAGPRQRAPRAGNWSRAWGLTLVLATAWGCDPGLTGYDGRDDGRPPNVTVDGWGPGSGRILGSPWIDCTYVDGRLSGACSAWIPPGTSLSFQAVPLDTASNGVGFEGWGGACASVLDTSCFLNIGPHPRALSAGWPGVTRLSGQIVHPRAAAMDGMVVELLVDGQARGSVPVDAAGFYDDRLVGSARDAQSVHVIVDAADHRKRTVYPAWLEVEPEDLSESIDVVVVPYRWTVGLGAQTGVDVDIDLERVLEDDPGLYLTTGRQLEGRSWQFQVQSVTRDRLPLTLAFDRAGSTVPVADIDIERYWRRIAEVEADYGLDLFTPWSDPRTADVRVGVSPLACGGATACADLATGHPFLDKGGTVFHQSTEQFRDDRGIVAHELTHILGFGHTCEWVSLMTAGPATCGFDDSGSRTLTAADMAYIELAMTVNTYQKALSLPAYGGGIMAAWNGHRVRVQEREPYVPPNCDLCRNAPGGR